MLELRLQYEVSKAVSALLDMGQTFPLKASSATLMERHFFRTIQTKHKSTYVQKNKFLQVNKQPTVGCIPNSFIALQVFVYLCFCFLITGFLCVPLAALKLIL